MTESIHTDIWKERAEKFNKIAWVNNEDLLCFLYESLDLIGKERILDAGIGTGALSKFILKNSPDVKMFGLDSSKEMIDRIDDPRIFSKVGDLRDIPFIDGNFDRVIFRNVLHHCVGYTSEVIEEVLRVLKVGGKIIICEGMPVHNDCVSDFSQFVTAKENRLVFTNENFLQMLFKFHNKCIGSIILKQQSVMNWLNNCVEDSSLRADIFDKHIKSSAAYKKHANLNKTTDDILVDMKFSVVRAER